jgi:hypothetical protein
LTLNHDSAAAAQKLPAEYVAYILGKYGPYRARLHWREALESAVDLQDLTALLRTQRRYKACARAPGPTNRIAADH